MRKCIKYTFTVVNSVFILVGVGMIIFSLFLLKHWFSVCPSQPWFLYTFMTIGIILCFITFFGHVAAQNTESSYFNWYMFSILLLLILQGGAVAYVLLRKNWAKEIINDSTGRCNVLQKFVQDYILICKLIGATALSVQVLKLLLAFALHCLGPDTTSIYDRRFEYVFFRCQLKQSFLVPPNSFSPSFMSCFSRRTHGNMQRQEGFDGVEDI